MSAVQSRPLMTLRLSTAPTQSLGAGPRGTRVTFPIIGGTFEGDRLRGYAYLNRLLAVGLGELRADGPVHVIEELL